MVAGAGAALQGTTRVLTGSVVPAVTTVVAAASGTAVQAAGALTSAVTSALPVVLGSTGSAEALQGTTQALTSAIRFGSPGS